MRDVSSAAFGSPIPASSTKGYSAPRRQLAIPSSPTCWPSVSCERGCGRFFLRLSVPYSRRRAGGRHSAPRRQFPVPSSPTFRPSVSRETGCGYFPSGCRFPIPAAEAEGGILPLDSTSRYLHLRPAGLLFHVKQDADISPRAFGSRFPPRSRRKAFCPPTAAPDTFVSGLPAFCFT